MRQNALLLLILSLLFPLTSCIANPTAALLSAGDPQPFATPDHVLSYDDVFSTTPASMSTEDGARIIREEFPDLCTNL